METAIDEADKAPLIESFRARYPELGVDLPATAIGKDYLGDDVFAATPSRTGAQLSLGGAVGLLAGWEEGLELNLFGFTFGLNPKRLALELPLIGNIGLADNARPRTLGPVPAADKAAPPAPNVAGD
mgnify:CR=1 FL=1